MFRRYAPASEEAGSLMVVNTDGSGERRLTDGASKGLLDDQPTWSPDGKQVVFSRLGGIGTDHESHRIALVSADGTGLRDLTPGAPDKGTTVVGFDEGAAFSPDGKQIAYAHGEGMITQDQIPHFDVMVMSRDGSHKRSVTHLPAMSGDITGVRWSPDGTQLVYSRTTGSKGKPINSSALFVVGANGGAQRQLTPWALGAGGIPAWSKSGLIAFRAVEDQESGIGNFYTIHSDGSGLTQVTHFVGQTVSFQVGISSDGQWLVFSKREGATGPNYLTIAHLGGSDVYSLGTPGSIGSSPDWSPQP